MTRLIYATLEDVKRALDIGETARSNGQILRALESGARAVEGLTKRTFRPVVDTRFFDWPDRRRPRSWRLWLDGDEVIDVDTLTAGGEAIDADDYFLEPANDGPPFTHIEIDLAGPAAFHRGGTHQRAIAVTGLFGYTDEEGPAGSLDGAVDDSTSTVAVTDSAAVGVGDVIRVDAERMVVTEKRMLDTGQNLQADLDAQASSVTVAVTDGSAYTEGEVLLIDAERMLIVDVAGDNLIVKRPWDGSVLDSHTSGAGIFAARTLVVARGALGTEAASHADQAPVLRHEVPGLVRDLNIAEAINTVQQEQAGYGRTVGAGESEREAGGRGLRDIRADVRTRYGRKARTGAI